MTDTRKRIEELKRTLPSLKEKVIAVAMLLCLSVAMVASVSYAWITMSVAPELGGVNTTVSANGALEIALVDYDGGRPNTTGVNDSFAAQNQTTHGANITWGNMVNLSSGYGIENLILRPAALDLDADVPLYSAKYDEGGRVEGEINDFGYTTWLITDASSNTWNFAVPELNDEGKYPELYQPNGDIYGVRAISSVAYLDDADADTTKMQGLKERQSASKVGYARVMNNQTYEDVITKLVQRYLDENIDAAMDAITGGSFELQDFTVSGNDYIPGLTSMLKDLYNNAVLKAGEALVYTANLQMQTYFEDLEAAAKEAEMKGETPIQVPEKPADFTLADLLSDSLNRNEELRSRGIRLTALGFVPSSSYDQYPLNIQNSGSYSGQNLFKVLHDTLKADLDTIQGDTFVDEGNPKQNILWSQLEPIVNHLIDINTVTIQGASSLYPNPLTVNQIANLGTGALSFVKGLGPRPSVVTHNGILKQFETLSGEFGTMEIPISVKKNAIVVEVDYTGTGVVTTDVSRTADSRFEQDQDITQKMLGAAQKRNLRALDTYGMMLDLWVRTNGENSLLTLNGTPVYEEIRTQLYDDIADPENPSSTVKKMVWTYKVYTGKTVELGSEEEGGIGEMLGTAYETEEVRVYKLDETKDASGKYVTDGDFYYFSDSPTPVPVTRVDLADSDGDGKMDSTVDSGQPLKLTDMNTNDEAMVQPKVDVKQVAVGYESANRIWTDEDFADENMTNNPPVLAEGEISATQGSGSCYIFYADSEEAYARALELLANLRLVFLDASGNEYARARLDVGDPEAGRDPILKESGKYTVPIIVDTTTHTTFDENGDLVYGICPLVKNQATWLSVLIYLEGEGLKNEMVLSDEDIIGSLNLQFDSTAVLRSVGDAELSYDVVSLSAGFGESGATQELNFNFGDEIDIDLTATVDGLSPAKVEAYFQRKLNSTQGSRLDPIVLTPEEGSNRWRGELTFSAPGTYVLNALYVDGVEYPLPQTLTVNVEGFAVTSVNFDTATVMTANRSVSRNVTVTIGSSIQPAKVQAKFLDADKRPVTAELKPMSTSGAGGTAWTGTANFTKSGTYTLTSLIMDGNEYVLNDGLDDSGNPDGTTSLQRTFTAYLGMKAEVTLERYKLDKDGNPIEDELGNKDLEPLEYVFEKEENIYAFVRILDDSNKPMTNLGSTITMKYGLYGSSLDSTGYQTELTWNGKDQFTGMFLASDPGKYVFSSVTVAGQTITSALGAPTLSLIPKEPPAYLGAESGSLIVGNSAVYYEMKISNATTANGWVILNDGTKDYDPIPLTNKGNDVYQVQIPDRDGAQNILNSNGSWTAKQLIFDNVYVDGELIEAGSANPYRVNLAGQPGTAFTAVNYLTMEITPNIVLGATEDAEGNRVADAMFMTSYKLSDQDFGLKVSAPIGGVAGQYLDPAAYMAAINSVQLKLQYRKDKSYGGYEVDQLGTDITVDFTALTPEEKATALSFQTNTDKTVQYAGYYTYELTVTLDGSTFQSKDADKTLLEIYSKRPQMKVTGVNKSTSSKFQTSTTQDGDGVAGNIDNIYNYYNDQYAVVYAEYGTLWGYLSSFTLPKVTTTLSDIANFTTATATGTGCRYDELTDTFTFKSNDLTDEQEFGKAGEGIAESLGGGVPLRRTGRQDFTHITVTYDANKDPVVVELAKPVTILMPVSVPHATFKEATTTSGVNLDKVPSRIIAEAAPDENGVFKYKITLPEAWTWEEEIKDYNYGDWVMMEGYPKTANVYTTRRGGFLNLTTYYTPYIETTTIQTATTTTTTRIDTYTITGWRINGVTYAPGETVEFDFTSGITGSNSLSIQAVISTVKGQSSQTTETTTWTVKEYTPNGSEVTRNPGGSKVDSATKVDEKVTK